jgi:uncharacterized protein YaiL (DUF2058 family)
MSESLQDQLRALGLAKDKPGRPGRKRKRRRPNDDAGRGGSPPGGKQGKGDDISLEAAWRARQAEEKENAERARAEKRARDLERRRLNTQIEALLEGKALNDRSGELKRNFLYKGKIRSVRVNAEQLAALNAGSLALVFLRGDYLVVEPAVADQVRALSPEHVPDLGGEDPGEEEIPVPDDIVW